MKVSIDLFPHQIAFVRSKKPAVCLAGGVGCGKTEVGVFKSVKKSFAEKYSKGVIASNTYKQLTDATLSRFLENLDKWKIKHKMNWNRMVLKIANNPDILCRTLTNWESLAGIEIGWFYIDEAWGSPVDGFRELTRRLRCPRATNLQGFLTTNLNGYDWIYDEFYEKPLSDPKILKNRCLIRATTLDNPLLVDEYITNLSATLTKELLMQWVFAQFVSVNSRSCYYNFKRGIHVKSSIAELDPRLPLRLTMDFNYNPLCGSVGQQSGNTAWTFDEFVINRASTWDLCSAFLQKYSTFGGDVYVYGDATGRRHHTNSKKSDWQIVSSMLKPVFKDRLHFKVPNSNPPVHNRLNAVNAKCKSADGQVTYHIHPRCRSTIMDFETAQTNELNPFAIEKRDSAGEPKTHPTDAVGYWLAKEFPIVRPTYSSITGGN